MAFYSARPIVGSITDHEGGWRWHLLAVDKEAQALMGHLYPLCAGSLCCICSPLSLLRALCDGPKEEGRTQTWTGPQTPRASAPRDPSVWPYISDGKTKHKQQILSMKKWTHLSLFVVPFWTDAGFKGESMIIQIFELMSIYDADGLSI